MVCYHLGEGFSFSFWLIFRDSKYPKIKILNESERKRILITGGAGFVGSHLVDRLMKAGHEVCVLSLHHIAFIPPPTPPPPPCLN